LAGSDGLVDFPAMVAYATLPLAEPPRISAIDIGTFGAADGPYSCVGGEWRFQLYLTPATVSDGGLGLGIREGCVGIWPPEARLRFAFSDRLVHACAHFLLPDDSEREQVPVVHDLGSRFAQVHRAFVEAVGWNAARPERARARLWDLLWEVASTWPARTSTALERAVLAIEHRLRDDLSVDDIAAAAGCSQRQLLRLFRGGFQTTVTAYLRRRRAAVAARLLTTTTMPMASVARAVGLADAHRLTRLMRREHGVPPSALRRP
jgi:AraC-like DNA-binding protein